MSHVLKVVVAFVNYTLSGDFCVDSERGSETPIDCLDWIKSLPRKLFRSIDKKNLNSLKGIQFGVISTTTE